MAVFTCPEGCRMFTVTSLHCQRVQASRPLVHYDGRGEGVAEADSNRAGYRGVGTAGWA